MYVEKYLKTAVSLVSKTSEDALPFPPEKSLLLLWESHGKLHPQNTTRDGLKGKQVLAGVWISSTEPLEIQMHLGFCARLPPPAFSAFII